MCNGDFIEQLQGLYNAKRFAILLEYTKPPRTVRGIGWFEDACIYFLFDKFAELVIETWGNSNISFHPRLVGNYWDIYWREEVFPKVSSFGIVPSEAFVMQHHEVM